MVFNEKIDDVDTNAVELLRTFGYTEQEASFLYLVITYSGFFTRQQFLRFTGKTKGWAVHRFTEKLLAREQATCMKLGGGVYLFQLKCREMYDALDKPNLRIRSAFSDDFIRARLFTLDFVMAHPSLRYLETSAGKLAFFSEKAGLPTEILPGKTYAGIHFKGCQTLYFTDRQPIFLETGSTSQSDVLRPVFVYCDAYERSLDAFKTYLKRYGDLLYRLADFRFVYASPHAKKLPRAVAMFDRFMRSHERVDLSELIRYFRVQWSWDNQKWAELTREDRDRIRAGMKKFCGEPFASAYAKWCREPLGNAELRTLLGPFAMIQNYSFDTHLLRERYAIFGYEREHQSGTKGGTIAKTRWSADRSVFRSVDEGNEYF